MQSAYKVKKNFYLLSFALVILYNYIRYKLQAIMEECMTGRMIRGLILIIIGAVFFLYNLGYDLNLDYYWLTIMDNIWPIILVAVGISIANGQRKSVGYILILLGLILVLRNYEIITISLGKTIRIVIASFLVFLGLKKVM